MGTYGESKIGLVRKVNEDSFYISHEKNVLAVADGMGGYVGGEIASKTDDSDLASLMKTLASNFEAADANGDGKVTHDEAMAYQEQNQATGATTTASTSSSSSASALDENVVKQIMQLVQTYSGQSSSKAQSSLGTVSIAA